MVIVVVAVGPSRSHIVLLHCRRRRRALRFYVFSLFLCFSARESESIFCQRTIRAVHDKIDQMLAHARFHHGKNDHSEAHLKRGPSTRTGGGQESAGFCSA